MMTNKYAWSCESLQFLEMAVHDLAIVIVTLTCRPEPHTTASLQDLLYQSSLSFCTRTELDTFHHVHSTILQTIAASEVWTASVLFHEGSIGLFTHASCKLCIRANWDCAVVLW